MSNKILKSSIIIFTIAVVSLMQGCIKGGVYEKNINIPEYKWDYNYIPQFEVAITDTNAIYNTSINLRFHDAYKYSNLWLKINITAPDGTASNSRFEVTMADASGKWLAQGLNEIYILNTPFIKNVKFKKAGVYKISIEQDMRTNPLNAILSVGYKVEKINSIKK